MKVKVVKILAKLGLDLSSATRIFFAKVIEQNGLPFRVKSESEVLWNPTKEQEKAFDRYIAERDLAKVWLKPSEDIWDEWYDKLPPIDTV